MNWSLVWTKWYHLGISVPLLHQWMITYTLDKQSFSMIPPNLLFKKEISKRYKNVKNVICLPWFYRIRHFSQTRLHWTWKWVCLWPQNSMLLKILYKGLWSCDTTMKTKRHIFENWNQQFENEKAFLRNWFFLAE